MPVKELLPGHTADEGKRLVRRRSRIVPLDILFKVFIGQRSIFLTADAALLDRVYVIVARVILIGQRVIADRAARAAGAFCKGVGADRAAELADAIHEGVYTFVLTNGAFSAIKDVRGVCLGDEAASIAGAHGIVRVRVNRIGHRGAAVVTIKTAGGADLIFKDVITGAAAQGAGGAVVVMPHEAGGEHVAAIVASFIVTAIIRVDVGIPLCHAFVEAGVTAAAAHTRSVLADGREYAVLVHVIEKQVSCIARVKRAGNIDMLAILATREVAIAGAIVRMRANGITQGTGAILEVVEEIIAA